MSVNEDKLKEYGSTIIRLKKNESLFESGQKCEFFYQVKSGSVKMVSYSEEGREYTQGIFKTGESFAEPALLCGFPYPATTIAIERSEIWKCSKQNFYKLLENNFDIHMKITQALGNRLRYKSMMLEEISLESAKHRLLCLMDFHRKRDSAKEEYKVPFSRQELANMTGLRVETVIRTIKALESSGEVLLKDGKIYKS